MTYRITVDSKQRYPMFSNLELGAIFSPIDSSMIYIVIPVGRTLGDDKLMNAVSLDRGTACNIHEDTECVVHTDLVLKKLPKQDGDT